MNRMILLASLIVVSLSIMHARSLNADAERDPDIDNRMRFAIVEGDTESVIKFLEQGANPNFIYSDGVTPVADAINRSRAPIEIVKVLIRYGADPKIKSNGVSPLSLALKMNNEELIRILHEYAESDAELYDIALYFLNKEKELSALEYADKALQLNPNNVNAWAIKGSIFSYQYKNIKYADQAYRKAFEASLVNLKASNSADDYKTAAWYALLSSDFNEALRLAREGLSLFPGDGLVLLRAGHALLFLGRKKEAILIYKKAYADLQRSEKDVDRPAHMMTSDFVSLKRRYPDRALELKWIEEKIREPFDFNYSEIPFGEGKDLVLGMAKGAAVRGEEKPVLGRLDPVVMKQLQRGIYPIDSDSQLHPDFAEKYSLAYEKWGALQRIDLFFAGNEGQRSLFLVSKYYKESGKIDDIFIRYRETISEETKILPTVHAAEIVSPAGRTPVKIAVWQLNNTTIILDVLAVSFDSSQIRVMYVSKQGWEKYAGSADAAMSQ